MHINNIQSFKYFEDLNPTLKSNINILIKNNYGLNFILDNNNLILFIKDFLMICSNGKLIEINSINLDYDIITYQNNKIFICGECSDVIIYINLHNREEEYWSISKKKDIYCCFSIDLYNNNIYVISYIAKGDSNYYDYSCDINIYSEYEKLLKNANVLNDKEQNYNPYLLVVNVGIIYLICNYDCCHNSSYCNSTKNKIYIYDSDISLICENKSMVQRVDKHFKIKILSANNHIIMRNKDLFFVYKY